MFKARKNRNILQEKVPKFVNSVTKWQSVVFYVKLPKKTNLAVKTASW